MSKETTKHMGFMIAYMAAREGGNDWLAREIADQAKKNGITIIKFPKTEIKSDK